MREVNLCGSSIFIITQASHHIANLFYHNFFKDNRRSGKYSLHIGSIYERLAKHPINSQHFTCPTTNTITIAKCNQNLKGPHHVHCHVLRHNDFEKLNINVIGNCSTVYMNDISILKFEPCSHVS